jgi:hypothetical protein
MGRFCSWSSWISAQPLGQRLGIVASANGGVELREDDRILAIGRAVRFDVPEIPAATFSEAEDAVCRTP